MGWDDPGEVDVAYLEGPDGLDVAWDPPDLGPCCVCGRSDEPARNVVMLPYLAPVPGTGHGCVVCGTPSNGAIAVVCDRCMTSSVELGIPLEPKEICYGYAGDRHRLPFSREAMTPFVAHTLPPESH